MANFFVYYKRFFDHWRSEIWSLEKEQMFGVLLAVLILFFQLDNGLIPAKDAGATARATVILPYAALLILYAVIHVIRTPWKLDQEREHAIAEITKERDAFVGERDDLKREINELKGAHANAIEIRDKFAELMHTGQILEAGIPACVMPAHFSAWDQQEEEWKGSVSAFLYDLAYANYSAEFVRAGSEAAPVGKAFTVFNKRQKRINRIRLYQRALENIATRFG